MDELITYLMTCEGNTTHDNPQTTTEVNEQTTSIPLDPDIAILQETYGELKAGMTIELDIASGCELLGKTRRRADTFKKLQKKLKEEYDVELIIKSRKHG